MVSQTVNWPLSGPVSLAAASLAVIETVAESLSAMVTVAVSTRIPTARARPPMAGLS